MSDMTIKPTPKVSEFLAVIPGTVPTRTEVASSIGEQSLVSQGVIRDAPHDPIKKGAVVVLEGTSSVGKTSIIQQINEQNAKQKWEEIDFDRRGPKKIEEMWENSHTKLNISDKDFQIFKSVLKPLNNNFQRHMAVWEEGFFKNDFNGSVKPEDSVFIQSATPEQRAIAREVAGKLREKTHAFEAEYTPKQFEYALKDIIANSDAGISSILGVLDVDDIFNREIMGKIQITTVFVYCSFDELAQRIGKRNDEAIANKKYDEIRTGKLIEFAKVFRPMTEEDKDVDPKVVQTLDRQAVERAFNSDFAIVELEKKRGKGADLTDGDKKELDQRKKDDKEKLLLALGFKGSDPTINEVVRLVPRKKHHIPIDTSKIRPAEAAQAILKKIL